MVCVMKSAGRSALLEFFDHIGEGRYGLVDTVAIHFRFPELCLFSTSSWRTSSSSRTVFDFGQPMAGARVEVETIELLQIANAFERCRAEWSLAVESVEHDPLEQIAQRHIVILGKSLKHLENALLHAHAGLNPFHQ